MDDRPLCSWSCLPATSGLHSQGIYCVAVLLLLAARRCQCDAHSVVAGTITHPDIHHNDGAQGASVGILATLGTSLSHLVAHFCDAALLLEAGQLLVCGRLMAALNELYSRIRQSLVHINGLCHGW
jgi:hypothetical protein